MKTGLNTSYIICSAGLGVAVGALAPAIKTPFLIVFAVGLGIILGGLFRALTRIERKMEQSIHNTNLGE